MHKEKVKPRCMVICIGYISQKIKNLVSPSLAEYIQKKEVSYFGQFPTNKPKYIPYFTSPSSSFHPSHPSPIPYEITGPSSH